MYRVYSGYSMYYAKSSTSPMNSLTSLDWGSRFSWVFLFSFFLFLFFIIRFSPLGKKSQITKNQNPPRILDPLAARNAHYVPIGPAIRPDLRPTLPRLSLSRFLSSDSKNAARCALIYSVQDTLSFPCPSLFPITALPSPLRKGYNVMGLYGGEIDYALPFWISTGV